MSKFSKEFKEFVLRGNVMDMAVGIIIGGAFGKIVSSLVNDVLMPLIGVLTGGVNFTELKWVIAEATVDAAGNEVAEVSMNYGMFIQNVVDFLIIAFVIFLMVKGINSLRRKKAEPEAAPAEPAEDVKLLTEIRDLLSKK